MRKGTVQITEKRTICRDLVFSFFDVSRIDANFLVIFFKSSKILTGLWEFAFLHTFIDVPVDKSLLGVQKVKLVVQTTPAEEIAVVFDNMHMLRDTSLGTTSPQ
jgi:hypothetical protein